MKKRSTDAPGKIRLNLDFDSLFPGDSMSIGNTSVVIRPLSILQLASMSKQLSGFGDILSDQGITFENYGTTDNIWKIVTLVLEQAPDVLSEASGIHVDDILSLPLDIVVELVNKVIEVNLEAKGNLSKNFKSLTEKIQAIVTPAKN
jgi:hypothetical protein